MKVSNINHRGNCFNYHWFLGSVVQQIWEPVHYLLSLLSSEQNQPHHNFAQVKFMPHCNTTDCGQEHNVAGPGLYHTDG